MTSRNNNNYSAAESYKVAYEFEAMRNETRLDRAIELTRANLAVYFANIARFFNYLSEAVR